MRIMNKPFLILSLSLFISAMYALSDNIIAPAYAEEAPQEIPWEALIPSDYDPNKLLEEYDVDSLDDSDPRAEELAEKIRELWSQAPVVKELDGKLIKLPGFVVPIETNGLDQKLAIKEFLLVPYYGACIHVPPPPANQTIYVKLNSKDEIFVERLFEAVWVTGRLRVEETSSDLADAGYLIQAIKVEPYEE